MYCTCNIYSVYLLSPTVCSMMQDAIAVAVLLHVHVLYVHVCVAIVSMRSWELALYRRTPYTNEKSFPFYKHPSQWPILTCNHPSVCVPQHEF